MTMNIGDVFECIDRQDEKLESIEAANYLIQELLAQIEALKEENNQFRVENEALRIQFEAVTLNPHLRHFSEYDVSDYPESSHYSNDNDDEFNESKSTGYAETVCSSASRMVQSDLSRYRQLQQQVTKLEQDGEKNRAENRQLMSHYSSKLKAISRTTGAAIDLVRPYYAEQKSYLANRTKAEELAIRYHQTVRELKNAQEMVRTFEDKVNSAPLDEEWLDRLNEANERVQDLIKTRDKTQVGHRRATALFQKSDRIMRQVSRKHPSSVEKCAPYFQLRDEFESKLDENGSRLKQIEMDLIDAKSALSSTLKNMGKRDDDTSSSTFSRSKPDGDDASVYEEGSFLDEIAGKQAKPAKKQANWSPYRIGFDEINEEADNQWEEDF